MTFDEFMAATFVVEFIMYAVIAIALAINGLYTGAFAIGMTVLGIVALVGAVHFLRAVLRRVPSEDPLHVV